MNICVADLIRIRFFHLNADTDPTIHFDEHPDPTFHFDADLDPAPRRSNAESATKGQQILYSFIVSLHASIVSPRGSGEPPWFHFEPPQLLNFSFLTDPAFNSDADPNPKMMRVHTDPDPQKPLH
jgi:hypothetical protein